MLFSTLERLNCPSCQAPALELKPSKTQRLDSGQEDVVSGTLSCPGCKEKFPILAGVAVLLENPGEYLIAHVKGVSREVPESEFPKECRARMIRAKAEIESEHIEEDLESERVASLYVMTHYLTASGGWWKPQDGKGSPVIEEWIRKYWDQGPFERIRKGVAQRAGNGKLSLASSSVAGLVDCSAY